MRTYTDDNGTVRPVPSEANYQEHPQADTDPDNPYGMYVAGWDEERKAAWLAFGDEVAADWTRDLEFTDWAAQYGEPQDRMDFYAELRYQALHGDNY